MAKLGDLGIAKHAKDNLAKTQIGTPYYLAPEIWDNQHYDYKCDIFSLGVVLYEMTTLALPFNGLNIQELKKSVRLGKHKPIPKEFSNELQELIKSLLRIQPELRPSADEIFDM